MESTRTVNMTFGIDYDDDIKKVIEVLADTRQQINVY